MSDVSFSSSGSFPRLGQTECHSVLRLGPKPVRRIAGPSCVAALLIVCAMATRAGAQTVWELTPYQIQVILAVGRAPELTRDFQADLAQELVGRVDALIGASWDMRVTDAPRALRYALLRDVESVTVELLEEELRPQHGEASSEEASSAGEAPSAGETPSEQRNSPEAGARGSETAVDFDDLDKVICLLILSDASGYRVVGRELDVRTRQWNTAVSVPAWHEGKLVDAAFACLLRAFAPMARIVDVEKSDVLLRLRAAGFPLRDESVVMVRPGDVFRPVVRHNDRYGKLRAVRPIPWTFLTVEEVTRSGLACKMHTGLRSPLTGRRRGGFEQIALAVDPPDKPTRLVLRSQTEPREPLCGYDVYSHPPDSKKTDLVGRTDRLGGVIVPPANHTLRVLLIKNGSEFLARLPLVPGMEAEVVADVRNDDQRLEAEGFIRGLEQELIDLVVRREVLMAQFRTRIKEKEYDEAAKLLHELRALETRDDFNLYLAQEQKKVFSADKLAQAKIDQMFRKTRDLVNAYLDPAVIDQLDRQLREARRAGPL
jgi:hypothetical protein